MNDDKLANISLTDAKCLLYAKLISEGPMKTSKKDAGLLSLLNNDPQVKARVGNTALQHWFHEFVDQIKI